ncbi:MAG: cytochrome C, partial [Planctomycetota bacterium]
NRLLHVVSGADFGYEYRYGRSGRHPLVCWYGENPGTLGMIGALGEAACGLISFGPDSLLSASWTDNRVDLHRLNPQGASFTATREPFLSGPDDFRPVHFAYSSDARYLYFTDWVKLSYPVHGHGRIWRVKFKEPIDLKPAPRDQPAEDISAADAIAMLGSDDAYVRTRAMHILEKDLDSLINHAWQEDANAIARSHYAVARKRADASRHEDLIPELLVDRDSSVRFVGIKWIADEGLKQYRSRLEDLLNRSDLSRRDLRGIVAAIARISGDSKKEFSPDNKLLELALDSSKPASLRAIALQDVDVDHKELDIDVLSDLALGENELRIKVEAVRSLVLHASPKRSSVLSRVASDESLEANLRADAIAGLASDASDHVDLLSQLSASSSEIVANEAQRTRVSAGLVDRVIEAKPKSTDVNDWVAWLDGERESEADPSVGRRLFFHAKFAGCYKCHAMNGRGRSVGPDLTTIHRQSGIDEKWLLEHIVNPNAEMAPYYRPQQLLTYDGEILTGLILGNEGKKQAYVGADGNIFYIDKEDVEARRELTTSIMPSGLLDPLSASEVRDLIAYLMKGTGA